MYLQLGLMGMEFEKLKKIIIQPTPIPEKQGRVRGNKNIFKVGLDCLDTQGDLHLCYLHRHKTICVEAHLAFTSICYILLYE